MNVNADILKGKEYHAAWAAHGVRVLTHLLRQAGLSPDTAKATVRDCHRRSLARKDTVRVAAERPASRSFQINVTPAKCKMVFEVDVQVPVANGKTWPDIYSAVQLAAAAITNHEPQASSTTAARSITGGKDSLLKLRGGIDTILSVSDDVKTAQDMLEEATKAAQEKEDEATPAIEEAERLRTSADLAARQYDDAAAEVARIGELMDKANADMLKAKETAQAAEGQAQAAEAKAKPLLEEIDGLDKACQEAERLLEEKTAVLQKSGDVAALIAALQKLKL